MSPSFRGAGITIAATIALSLRAFAYLAQRFDGGPLIRADHRKHRDQRRSSGFPTLAGCVLIGQPLDFANIIALPLLFGLARRSGWTNLLQSSLARGTTLGRLLLISQAWTLATALQFVPALLGPPRHRPDARGGAGNQGFTR